jgi:hypothetical protein
VKSHHTCSQGEGRLSIIIYGSLWLPSLLSWWWVRWGRRQARRRPSERAQRLAWGRAPPLPPLRCPRAPSDGAHLLSPEADYPSPLHAPAMDTTQREWVPRYQLSAPTVLIQRGADITGSQGGPPGPVRRGKVARAREQGARTSAMSCGMRCRSAATEGLRESSAGGGAGGPAPSCGGGAHSVPPPHVGSGARSSAGGGH